MTSLQILNNITIDVDVPSRICGLCFTMEEALYAYLVRVLITYTVDRKHTL